MGRADSAGAANLPVSGLRIDRRLIAALGQIKSAAATINAELGLLDADMAAAIEAAAAEVAEGALADVVKAGRTHLMDAIPVTLGQEFGGYAAAVRRGAERISAVLPQVGELPLGVPRSVPSVRLLAGVARLLADRCVAGRAIAATGRSADPVPHAGLRVTGP